MRRYVCGSDPARTRLVERPHSSMSWHGDFRPHSTEWGIAGLIFNPKLGRVVGVRLTTALEFSRSCEIDLFVDPRRTNARRGKQGAWNLWEGGEGVLDVRVGEREMELADGLQTLESVSQGVGQVAKQGVDQLLKVVPLVGPDRNEVVEYLVVASSVELLT